MLLQMTEVGPGGDSLERRPRHVPNGSPISLLLRLVSPLRMVRRRASDRTTFDAFTIHYPRFEAFTLFLQGAGRARLHAVMAASCRARAPGVRGDGRRADRDVATVGLTPGWATFGQAVPQGVATTACRSARSPRRPTSRTAGPTDRSASPIVTVNVPTAGNYSDHARGALPSGTSSRRCRPRPSTLTIGGVAYTATLPAHAVERRVAVGPAGLRRPLGRRADVAGNGTPHPFLRVIFDTRVYNDGTARVDVTVENVLDKAGATTVTYDVALAVNGATVFTKTAVAALLPDALAQGLRDRRDGRSRRSRRTWRRSTARDALPAVPLARSANQVNTPTGATYDILRAGALDPNMPAHGGRAGARAVSRLDGALSRAQGPDAARVRARQRRPSGSWPVHVREAESSAQHAASAPSGSSRSTSARRSGTTRARRATGWDYMAGHAAADARVRDRSSPGPGQTPLIPDNAHQPSMAFVPYLLTGDRYYAEEMAFWANYCMLRTYPGDGVRGAQGILANNEVRGFGWALRNMADAAAYYPDASPVARISSQKVTEQPAVARRLRERAGPGPNPFKILWLGKRPDGAQFISLWEQTYLAYAIDRANQHGFTGGLAHRDAIARFQLKLFTSEPDYPRAQAAPI